MWQQNSGVGWTESLATPPTAMAARDSLLTRRTCGNELKPTTATLEPMLMTLARLEARLDDHEQRATSTLPPSWPETDPNWDPSTCWKTPRHRAFQEYVSYDHPPYQPQPAGPRSRRRTTSRSPTTTFINNYATADNQHMATRR